MAVEKIVYYPQFPRGGAKPCHGVRTLGEAPGPFKRQREREELLLARTFIVVSVGIDLKFASKALSHSPSNWTVCVIFPLYLGFLGQHNIKR